MSSVFAMIAKLDLPAFEKGDIITVRQDDSNFGANILFNAKFRIVEVLDATLEEAESLVLPLTINANTADQYQAKSRLLTVDVDALTDYEKIPKNTFLSLISRKVFEQPQTEDVIV